jgi:Uroporphyrinogen decarboxylase (URO-D)
MQNDTTDFRQLPLAEMEDIVARFEERIYAAQRNHPPTKQWVRDAIHRKGAARCPTRLRRLSYDIIVRYDDALADLFCEFPDDTIALAPYDIAIGYQPPEQDRRLSTVQALMQAMHWTDEWGTQWAHAYGGVGASQVGFPLQDWSQLDEYLTRIPDPAAPGRFDAVKPLLAEHGATKYTFGYIHLSLFERLHSLRGMANVFMDFYTSDAEVRRLLDALCGYLLGMVRGWAQVGADAVFMTDDWGTQQALMISPVMWREFFKSYYKTVVAEAHRLGLDVVFHSCGNVTAIVDDLIDVGVDALDPVQPGAMDAAEVARRFGGRIAFCGSIDDQHLLATTPREIKDAVRRTMDTLGRPFRNALVVGPANILTPEAPLENLRALFEACHEQ